MANVIVKFFSVTELDCEESHTTLFERMVKNAIKRVLKEEGHRIPEDYEDIFLFSFNPDPTITSDKVPVLVEISIPQEWSESIRLLRESVHGFIVEAFTTYRRIVGVAVHITSQNIRNSVYYPKPDLPSKS